MMLIDVISSSSTAPLTFYRVGGHLDFLSNTSIAETHIQYVSIPCVMISLDIYLIVFVDKLFSHESYIRR